VGGVEPRELVDFVELLRKESRFDEELVFLQLEIIIAYNIIVEYDIKGRSIEKV